MVGQLRAAIGRQEEIAVEILNYRKNGSTFWNALFVSPVFGDDGKLLYFFGSQLDISRRREAEDALHEAQKLEAVGKLTGGIAHDFKIISSRSSSAGYVDISNPASAAAIAPGGAPWEAIGSAATRGSCLTQQLLAFARRQELRDRLLNFNSLLSDFRPILARMVETRQRSATASTTLWGIAASIRYRRRWRSSTSSPTPADAVASNGGTSVTIATRNVRLPDEHEAAGRRLAAGDYVLVRIMDDGPGFDQAVLDKVFDPFFTTKEMGKGAAASPWSMASRSSRAGSPSPPIATTAGRSQPVLPPRRRDDGAKGDRDPVTPRGQRGGARPMVEDQPDVAELGRAMLTDLGYDVTVANGAREALDRLEENAENSLLFTDILMPGGMNGVALANRVKRDHPRIAILLTTGFADEAIDEGAKSYE
ncbi:response regulator [Sphingomonas sp. MMS24-JH45]